MRRQQQHQGRSSGPLKDLIGADVAADPMVNTDPVAAAEDAREITRILDESEGFDRPEPKRNPM